MSLYGRFFSPDEKTTLRKVLDRTSVLTAVECLAYITNEKQAMHELFSKKAKNGRYVYDKKENERHDIEHQPYIDYINEVISRQGISTEGDIDCWNDLICIRDYIAQDILGVYEPDGYGSNNYDDMKVMDILLDDESKNLTMWPSMKWAARWNPKTYAYSELYEKYVNLHWKLDKDADDYDPKLTVKKFESSNKVKSG